MPPILVVGTDFSEPAARALVEARSLAERLGADLRLVHVLDGAASLAWQPGARELSWLGCLQASGADLETRRGTPWVELARVAEECAAQAVVVGVHGATGFQTMALGSTALRLSLASRRPVVLVGRVATAVSGEGIGPRQPFDSQRRPT